MNRETSYQQDVWFGRLRLNLTVSGHFDDAEVDGLVSEAEQYCADSGEVPEDAFGTPSEYSEELIRERVPDADRARAAASEYAIRNILPVLGMLFGFWMIVHPGILLFSGDWTFRITVGGVVGWSIVALAVAVMSLGTVLRNAGKPRWGLACWLSLPPLAVAAAMCFVLLPRIALFEMWSIVPAVLGIAMFVLSFRQATPDRQVARDAPEPDDVELWFGRLHGLLVGRHDVPSRTARKLVAESKAHLRNSDSTTPDEEFGPLEQYALRVAEGIAPGPRWWQRQEITQSLFAGFWLVMFGVELIEGEWSWITWMYPVMAVLFGSVALFAWRRARPSSPAAR